ncbi:hypothetical protein CTI12_AA614040 [Artemisia annua]|uniref:Uncharacterized protein n=1 Tax=Artemisia annua TaxID=35608 RepID=A0A2U1KE24_ARTAN|nr:hypothetical protein CTI12_AA614040 [Artemisia annua]
MLNSLRTAVPKTMTAANLKTKTAVLKMKTAANLKTKTDSPEDEDGSQSEDEDSS